MILVFLGGAQRNQLDFEIADPKEDDQSKMIVPAKYTLRSKAR